MDVEPSCSVSHLNTHVPGAWCCSRGKMACVCEEARLSLPVCVMVASSWHCAMLHLLCYFIFYSAIFMSVSPASSRLANTLWSVSISQVTLAWCFPTSRKWKLFLLRAPRVQIWWSVTTEWTRGSKHGLTGTRSYCDICNKLIITLSFRQHATYIYIYTHKL